MAKYTVSEDQKKQYAGVYLLNVMINTPCNFPAALEGTDQDLEQVLEWLMMKEYIEIDNTNRYVPVKKGRDVLKLFMERYVDYLRVFDIYCAVDLEEGTFAFESYFDFDDDEKWFDFLDKERWDDMRIAVAEFKKLDPIEIVFMNFLDEDKFGSDEDGWQFDLLLGSIWDHILTLCNAAISVKDLEYEDEEGIVSGEEVIKDIIEKGAKLNSELKKKELENCKHDDEGDEDDEEEEDDNEYSVDPVIIEEYPVGYYSSYYDPFYVSPMWLIPWLL